MPIRNNFYESKSIPEVIAEFNVNSKKGLTKEDVTQRQCINGFNEIKEKQPSPVLLFFKHFWGITAIMLEITIIISFLLHKHADAYLISGLMIFNAVIGFWQEWKATKTVEAMRESLQVFCRVLRDGEWQQIKASQLVQGDIIRIRSGDFVAADSKIIDGMIEADESALTGESILVSKTGGGILYSGSVIKNGECNAVVTAIGTNTFFGKTSQLIQTSKPHLHMEEVVAKVVKILFSIVLFCVGTTIIISLIHHESMITIFPLILILLVSAIPVALPAMFTISMAQGSEELTSKGVLISRLSATEDAATLTTLCIDKTGTITKNKLSIQELIPSKNFTSEEVLQFAVLASVVANNDPIDMAFIEKGKLDNLNISKYEQISFTPFSASTKRTEAQVQHSGKQFKIIKGAYNTIKNLSTIQDSSLDNTVNDWAIKGYRTIAIAIDREGVTSLVGIAALVDPPLSDSEQMIHEIKELGITIKMLTGDALPIAKEIGRKVGIGQNIISAEMIRLHGEGINHYALIKAHDGFSEVLPEDKFNIVKTLQDQKEITGMTGDGVNDAPALKQAEVGIAVMSATDVAKQSASVILLTEGLGSIKYLIIVGRTIHHRITNWVVSKISKTLFTILFVCVSYLITGQFVVSAFDMVLLLFIIDFVTLTLSTDKVSWSKKPENWDIKPLLIKGFSLGVLIAAEILLWLFIGKKYFKITNENGLHSFSFMILSFASLFTILIIRVSDRFYKQGIGKIVLYAIIVDLIVISCITFIGFLGINKLSLLSIVSTLVYIAACSFLINDQVKIWLQGKKVIK
jgi:H+-transporting ATPase